MFSFYPAANKVPHPSWFPKLCQNAEAVLGILTFFVRETPPLKQPPPGASFSSRKAECSLHFPSSEQVNILSLFFHLPSSLKKISYAFYFPNTHTWKRSAVRAGALVFPDLSLALKH